MRCASTSQQANAETQIAAHHLTAGGRGRRGQVGEEVDLESVVAQARAGQAFGVVVVAGPVVHVAVDEFVLGIRRLLKRQVLGLCHDQLGLGGRDGTHAAHLTSPPAASSSS